MPLAASNTKTAPQPIQTLTAWTDALLRRIGAPVTTANRAFISGWAKREGTAAANNPLATTLRLPGSVPLPGNPAGVQQYTTPASGVEATARTLLSGYPSIVSELRTGNPRFTLPVGSELGKWSGGGYSSFTPGAGYPWAGRGLGPVDTAVNTTQQLVGAAAGGWEAGALRVSLYFVFTIASLGLIYLGLARATRAAPGPAGYVRGIPGRLRPSRAAASEIPF
jgi:hypothetical protein